MAGQTKALFILSRRHSGPDIVSHRPCACSQVFDTIPSEYFAKSIQGSKDALEAGHFI